MSVKGIWIAFGVGVAAGAAVALLYAPQPGVKTRRQLRRNFDDGVDYLEDAASQDVYKRQSLPSTHRTAPPATASTATTAQPSRSPIPSILPLPVSAISNESPPSAFPEPPCLPSPAPPAAC